jgi:hypothetical protein
LLGWNGAAVEPTLADVATEPKEHVGDGLTFNTLGNGSETETVSQADDGSGDLSALTRAAHGADEAGVDLDFIEGEKLKVAKAGVAGPEIVERQARTLLF